MQLCVADCETDPFKRGRIPKPFLWGFFDGAAYLEFEDTDKFIEHVCAIECTVYAHNGGKFDWFFILEHLEEFQPITIINGRLSKFKIGKAEFRDSYNILPIALAEYKKDEIDYRIFEKRERNKKQNNALIRRYLKSDCLYLHEIVSRFIEQYGQNLTLASAAMKFWQKLTGETAPKTTSSFYADIARFYYGGHVEAFKPGIHKKKLYLIDINSAYPDAMQKEHPYGVVYSSSNKLPQSRAATERAFIVVNCISKGAFPFRTGKSLSFPKDTINRTYHVTGWEFTAACDLGLLREIDVRECVEFADTINFTQYVKLFYALKAAAKLAKNTADYIFSKLFQNALYGKFGANPENYSEYTITGPEYIQAAIQAGYTFSGDLDKWALMEKPLAEEKRRYYNVAVAASITGCVRAHLMRTMKDCKNVYYCDTDSLLVEKIGKDVKLHNTDLGAWDIEAEINCAAIAGKKLYSLRKSKDWIARQSEPIKVKLYKTASKGAKLTPEQIYQIAKGIPQEYLPDAPSFSIARGITFLSRKLQITVADD
jgi:hypothetical protein